MPRTRPPYPEQFRREVVELVRTSGRPVKEIAKDLGVTEQSFAQLGQTVRGRCRQAPRLSSDEREELRRLRRENRKLREERRSWRKPRPSSPRRAIGTGSHLPVRRRGGGQSQGGEDVRGARRRPRWFLCAEAPSDRELKDAWLLEKVREIHAASQATYGAGRESTPSCGSRMAFGSDASGSRG
jgi:transposase